VPDIDAGKLEYVAQKGTVRFRILAVDNRVRSNDQGKFLLFPQT
jgi:hypothetical protein